MRASTPGFSVLRRGLGGACAAIVWSVVSLHCCEAADAPAAVARVEAVVEEAQGLLEQGLPGDAALVLADVRLPLEEVADLGREVEPATIRQLAAGCAGLAEQLLAEGVAIEGLPTAQQLLRRRAEEMRRQPPPRSTATPPMAQGPVGPSFAGQIAPLLVRSCGRCHVEGSRGDFSMRSFAVLAASGMVVPGDGPNSRLVEVIRTGDMPRGGGRVAADELAMLAAWITAGAVFDGADPTVALDQVRPAAAMAEAATEASPTTPGLPEIGPDEIPFSSDVAGILVDNCQRCHGGGNPSGDFSLDTFAELADSGVIEPGRGEESLLVRKLLGVNIDGQRMPRGRPPLPDETIAVIRQWIDEGARLDLLDGTAELTRIASEGRSRNFSHEQLREVRFQEAPLLWRRGIVDEEGGVELRGDLCLVGNLQGERLAAAADAAADVAGQLRTKFRMSEPLVKGGIAVFAFARGYDFSNFWQNVMGRERPRDLLGHADVSCDVVYAAVAIDPDADNGRLMFAAELTAATLRARGAPGWFAEAAGRRVARSLVPEASMLAIWDDAEVVAKSSPPPNPESFFAAPLSAEQVTIASAALAAVDREGDRLPGLISRLEKGDDFDTAFRQTYRGLPEQMLMAWVRRGR